jgi:hypothetical protein
LQKSHTQISLSLTHKGAKDDVIDKMRLVSGSQGYEYMLNKNEKAELSYSGNIPGNNVLPILQLSMSDRNEQVIIPLVFLKILPIWSAIIMALVQIIAIISLFITGIIVLKQNKLIQKNDKITKPSILD